MTVGMSERFWGEVVMMTAYLLKRSPTRSLDRKTPHEVWNNKKTPHEVWNNKKPMVHHLRVFSYVVYMKITHPHLAKLDPREMKVVFIDYRPGSKAYKLYDPAGERAHVSSGSGTTWLRRSRPQNNSRWSTSSPSQEKEEPNTWHCHRLQ